MFKKFKGLFLAFSAVILVSANGITGECHTLSDASYTVIEGTVLRRGAGITDAAVANDVLAYQKIPDSIKNMLVANGINIYEVDAVNDSIATDGSYGVATAPTYKLVTRGGQTTSQVISAGYIDILSNKAALRADSQSTLLHEVGHQVDFLYLGGYPVTRTYYNASGQQEWQGIYFVEKNAIASYSKDAACNVYTFYEAFAEAAGLYFGDPEWLQQHCPLSYAYVDKVVAWF